MSLTPSEYLVLEVVRELIKNPPNTGNIDYDDYGTPWLKVPAKSISDLLLSESNLTYSEKRTSRTLKSLVSKGYLLRVRRIGEHKWNASYFYRLPKSEGT